MRNENPTIERSGGEIVQVAGMLAVVGGGYCGLTDELDAAVMRAAVMLRDTFPGWDVEIRFNSDRKSGGAWLVTPQRADFWRNGEVKLGAQLVPIMEGGYDPVRWLEMPRAEREALPCRVEIVSSVDEGVMRDPSVLNAGAYGDPGYRKHYTGHDTLEAGIAHLAEHVDPAKLGTTQPRKVRQ